MITISDIDKTITNLKLYIQYEDYKGYDPYDLLNSKIGFQKFGHKFCFYSTQIYKRLPFNIRPLIGVNKEIIPKGMGLLLSSYCNLYLIRSDESDLERMEFILGWLMNNYTKGFSGYCWGLNYDYASAEGFFVKNLPSLVVTSFIFNGIYDFYNITKKENTKNVLISIGDFILNDLPISIFNDSICFSHSPRKKTLHYNANALCAQMMAKLYKITGNNLYKEFALKSARYLISKQKPEGYWNYSESNGVEKKQIDFHQGFIIDSLKVIIDLIGSFENGIIESYTKGTYFYKKYQFYENGQSKWRLPKIYPVDIHNQAQGIITFSNAALLNPEYENFAMQISDWTIKHMFDEKRGYFYYRKYETINYKTSFMRWNQAWMLLALTNLLNSRKIKNGN